ncbi:thiol reductant ABC exporter subunit CydC, partial [Streptomyces albidoflavus]|nr:thiol reductant ABC exporter subunit CydC [Streptomyces albidoflavus]
ERRLAPVRGALATRVAEVLTGTGELTVAGALAHRTARTGDADRELTRIRARGAAANALGAGLTAVITGLTTVAAAYVGIRGVSAGALDGVALAVVVLTPLAAFEAVNALPLAVQFRQRVRRSAERVHEVLDAPAPVTEPEAAGAAPESPFPVELRGVAVRHPGQARDALTGIELTVAEGRRIAVVGPSGSGKTTLAQLLLRFLDPRTGSYTLAGASAPELDGDDLRRLVGLCAQDAHVFDSTLRENLLLADRSATEARLREVLARARLLEWAETLPQGLDTPVGEHGARLSGGQRQRLALARALLADFPLLVLDEPAEHLDLETADRLTADLLAATRGRTTLLITHRLAGLEAVDEILVLDAGRVVQRGTYEELSVGDGPFRRLRERERATDALLLGRAGVPA